MKSKQKTYKIDNLAIGGKPGELPTVLVGNVFYKGMPEVSNHKEGLFDKQAVSRWIRRAEELSEKTGVPHLIDVMAMYTKAMERYVEFISGQTSMPFLVDGANPETRKAALTIVEELGLEKHVIFNGITPKTSREELVFLKNSGVNAAILVAFNELDFSPQGRINILKGDGRHAGLLDKAGKGGIKKPLIDTVVFDVPSILYASEAILLEKKELGYPAGCSPANATYSWKQTLKDSSLSRSFAATNASAHTIVQCWGSDYLIYGPIKQAGNMIPSCAINDAAIAYYSMKEFGTKPQVDNHPLYRIF